MVKLVTDFSVKGKRVLVRTDFDVPLGKDGNVLDSFRIEKTIPLIEYLIEKGAKIILMSHLGRPKPQFQKEFSLCFVQEKLLEYLDCSITKADDCIGKEIEKWTRQMQPGEILLLENLRFHSEEKANDLDFSRSLAKLGDIYINEAFGDSHRVHASIVGVPKILPAGIGFSFQEEIRALSKILEFPTRPLVGIIGGIKLVEKIKPIPAFLRYVDFLLVGGKVGNVIVNIKGKVKTGSPFIPEVEELIKEIDLSDSKLRLPIDTVVSAGGQVFDIGPKTVRAFSQVIKQAKTIFWVGPLGNTREEVFSKGSLAIAGAVRQSGAFSIAGGGDTVFFLRKNNLAGDFNHLSSGGGAMLEYLSTGTLPALEALK